MTGGAMWPSVILGARVRLERSEVGYSVVRLVDEATVGRLELSMGSDGAVTIDGLCVDASERGIGAGSEAAWLIRQGLAGAGVATLRAWAPPDRGLAVYFWSRMGFRPLFGEGPNGGIWFERALEGPNEGDSG